MQRRDFLRNGLLFGTAGLSGSATNRPLDSTPVPEPTLLYVNTSYAYDLLVSAITKREIGTLKSLIDQGADVDAKNEYGWTPLHLVTLSDNFEVAQFLVANGADVNTKDPMSIPKTMAAVLHSI